MGVFDKFKIGFKKTAFAFTSGLKDIIVKKEIDDKTLNQIEEYLIQSDVGLSAAAEIKQIIAQEKIDPKNDIMNEVSLILREAFRK
jgi:fused signal recognition particle receptor